MVPLYFSEDLLKFHTLCGSNDALLSLFPPMFLFSWLFLSFCLVQLVFFFLFYYYIRNST